MKKEYIISICLNDSALLKIRTSLEQCLPRHFKDLGVRRNDANDRTLVEHGGNFARLNGYQVATDAVDDGLEHDETFENFDGLIQHETTQSEKEFPRLMTRTLDSDIFGYLPTDEEGRQNGHPSSCQYRPRVLVSKY